MATKLNLSEKTNDELKELLSEKRELARSTRFNSFISKPKDSSDPKKHRADIARILTELGKRERQSFTAATA